MKMYLFVRAERDGKQFVGGEEELCLSNSRTAETSRRTDVAGEERQEVLESRVFVQVF